LISKRLARDIIPFKKDELKSDIVGIFFSIVFLLPPATLVASPIFGTLVAGVLGIVASALGVVWALAYFLAIRKRDLPDVPEDKDK